MGKCLPVTVCVAMAKRTVGRIYTEKKNNNSSESFVALFETLTSSH